MKKQLKIKRNSVSQTKDENKILKDTTTAGLISEANAEHATDTNSLEIPIEVDASEADSKAERKNSTTISHDIALSMPGKSTK